ncbi:MAG: aromatic amino acid ammonia-lyase [Rhodospirillales bacterium]|nr:aromatic amino acid ammonia-lyase [Rhodospirillales bacterium]MDH3790954.1 aromatic amino acid ammonia-lyase [Rhodospirillales bacterium]MDH3912260.1 aromatic amino acid ammonia-lyase [Rhodospirillales bacterium]MDH3969742.1 aromatic amino acid ammonia-lyase [Rhodospirillales bacterium]
MTVTLHLREDITLDAFYRVAWQGESVTLHQEAMAQMAACREAFLRLIDSDRDIVVYGVTSGYGQMAHLRFTPEERRRHAARPPLAAASSFGEPLPERVARGIVLARLANFIEGHAAVSPALAEAVAAMLGGGRLPPVPELGNGCPGEIQALSHLFLELAGRRDLAEKDGLALVNGSPCASALIADAVLAARQRLALAVEVFALSTDALKAPLGAYDAALDGLWEDPHEAAVLRQLRTWLEGAEGDRRPYQAPVSWRILPRVLGQAQRALGQGEEVAAASLKAVSDNPLFLPPDEAHPNGRAVSTGGYHNAKAYPALDNLAAAWADLALLCDRQTTKLLDGKVSGLPDQLLAGEGGYLGCLGFTAAGYAEQARQAAQRSFLPGSEGGGFGQNDVAVPTFLAWRKEAEAGRCLDAGLACLAAVASQAFQAADRLPPPRLRPLLDELRDVFPPFEAPRAPGPEAGRLQRVITAKVFPEDEADRRTSS